MNWENIIENTISGFIVFALSSIITFIFYKLFKKRKEKNEPKRERYQTDINPYLKNPFLISLFITIFLFVLTGFFLIYSGSLYYYNYTMVAGTILLIITYLIYDNQCPNCKKIFHKKLKDKITMKDEKRPYRYRDETIYYYTDGSIKERKFTGQLKTILETYRTEKLFYECDSCHHKWERIKETNLDIGNRPKPNKVTTKIKPPENYNF
jgi:amino acid permease